MALKKKLTKKTQANHQEKGVEVSVEITKPDGLGGRVTEQVKGATVEDEELNPTQNSNLVTVGLSKGMTVNLGGYESARISCWISKPCENDDTVIMDTLADISNLIDEQIEFEVNEIEEMKN